MIACEDEQRVVTDFQRRRARCGAALVFLLIALVYLLIVLGWRREQVDPLAMALGMPLVIHFLLAYAMVAGTLIFIGEMFRCPRCDSVPRVPGPPRGGLGLKYTADPAKCHACGARLKPSGEG